MIEVEAKVRVKNLKEARAKIRKIGKYKGRERKIDDYYALESLREYPRKSLRVRRMNGKYIINFKQRISYDAGVFAKKEVEFETSDIAGFIELIKNFGFRKWLRKEKETELYEIKKNFHIEINYVKKLGYFLEVEYLAEKSEIGMARREVERVLHELGIEKNDIVKDGYTKMLWNLRH